MSSGYVILPQTSGGGGVTSINGDTTPAQIITGTNTTVSTSGGTTTISIPQSVATSASPTFNDITLSGLTANKGVFLNGSNLLVSQSMAYSIAAQGPVVTAHSSTQTTLFTFTTASNFITKAGDTIAFSIVFTTAGTSSNVMTYDITVADTHSHTLDLNYAGAGAAQLAFTGQIKARALTGTSMFGFTSITGDDAANATIATSALQGAALAVADVWTWKVTCFNDDNATNYTLQSAQFSFFPAP